MMESTDTRAAPTYTDIVAVVSRELDKVNTSGIQITETTDLTTELNIDSVAVMDLLFELEEHYDVSVPLNRLGDVRTVGQLAEVVREIAATA